MKYNFVDCLQLGLVNCFNLSLLEMEAICSEDFGELSISCCNRSMTDCNQTLYEPSTTINLTSPLHHITATFATTFDVTEGGRVLLWLFHVGLLVCEIK